MWFLEQFGLSKFRCLHFTSLACCYSPQLEPRRCLGVLFFNQWRQVKLGREENFKRDYSAIYSGCYKKLIYSGRIDQITSVDRALSTWVAVVGKKK